MIAVCAPAVAHADTSAYVRARAAAADGAVDAAAAGYAAAMAAAPGDEVVAIRAYRNALASGDLVLARRAAAVLTRSDVAPADVSILDLADAIRTGNRTAADDALGRIGAGPLDFLAPVVRAWLAYDRGADPFAILDNVKESGLSRRYIAEHRALLLIASNRTDEGLAALRAAMIAEAGNLDLRWNAATLLVAKGERKAALALLDGDDADLAGLRANLRRGVKPGPAFGASRAFTRLAADLADQQTEALSILLTRAALSLDPGDDRARLLLAEALTGEEAYGSALATLDAVRKDSAFYTAAQTERIDLIKARGESATALGIAAALATRGGASITDRQRYADLLVEAGREAEAARVYAAVLTEAGNGASWIYHLQLGGALERSGQWEAALPQLRKAVELGPEQPVALNYLGYALVDRGEKVAEGRALLERASALRPDDPAITDSLGWAYFRGGDYAKALPLLERAAQGNPSSPTINEHLGDVYWKAGRRFEARYAWRAAALYAEGEQQSRLAGKLSEGLKTDTPAARKGTEVGRWVGARTDQRMASR
ncbi:tetratricopeptide repeat protein [Sphingomonas sp. MG17]|uniref:Tetratricopeptide repeat protein n=1 Tax=Sphingomonas tagetis TaxID=2949092 RepID=A0A9X2HNB3_9SPHN|nr:tetratricopeptide repeat protein [Sphingomonas tagetis]